VIERAKNLSVGRERPSTRPENDLNGSTAPPNLARLQRDWFPPAEAGNVTALNRSLLTPIIRARRCEPRLATVPLLIVDDLGMRKLAHTAAEDLLELIMRRYERASTLLTSNRPVDDWGKLLGDTAAVTALLDRLLHHAHVLNCGPRSWRTKVQTDLRTEAVTK
jgi:hypothetical protein